MSEAGRDRQKPRAPARLGSAGRRLWREMVDEYEFDSRELVVLEAACRQRDDLAALEEEIREGGVIVEGSRGQPRLAQAVTEARQGRLALSKLLDALALPVGEGDVPTTGASRRAQKAANIRWLRAHREREGVASG